MRRCLLMFFLLMCSALAAQRKVADLLAPQKRSADSLMRVQYGALFPEYFVFDPLQSGGNFDHHGNGWNDSVTNDTANHYYFVYLFVFPGARIDSFADYDFHPDSNYCPTRGAYGEKYSARCIAMNSAQMNAVTQAELAHPLPECTVRLYRYLDFSDSLYSALDSSHVFLEVESDSIVYFGRKQQHYKLWRKTIVVDACTGSVVSRDTLYFRNKNYKEGWFGDGPGPCVR
jgi:hypothetical protein